MKILFVHPGVLLYSEIFLKLEPLGLVIVATAARKAGHVVRLLDLQIFGRIDFIRELREFRPDAIGLSLNYLANVPDVIELAVLAKSVLPASFVFAGGHSASFIPDQVLGHAAGAIDCVVRGEGESVIPELLAAVKNGGIEKVPGAVTPRGKGPEPELGPRPEEIIPDRSLLRKPHRYFIGPLDPCASIEFSRGCPWDCAFCSAWTFYNRTYRAFPPDAVVKRLKAVHEPNVFVLDDVAFVREEQGMVLAELVRKNRIRKNYYMETRADVLVRNRKVFASWRKLGLEFLFLGLESLDESGLARFRKRSSIDVNRDALKIARELGVTVSLNIIADPEWEKDQFEQVRQWALRVPEIVHLSIMTPYPGTEQWTGETRELSTRDYRLFDIQHAVLPTRLPLARFYREMVRTQDVLNRKHLGASALRQTFFRAAGLLMRGRTNFLRMLWKFNSVYDPVRLHRDHYRDSRYRLTAPCGNRTTSEGPPFVHKR